MTHDLDALRAAVEKADNEPAIHYSEVLRGLAGADLFLAARSGLLDDAALGRAYKDAATYVWTRPEGGPTEIALPPERVRALIALGLRVEAWAKNSGSGPRGTMRSAARALVAMQEGR